MSRRAQVWSLIAPHALRAKQVLRDLLARLGLLDIARQVLAVILQIAGSLSPAVFQTTAFRVAALNASVFIALAAGLVGYLWFATAGRISASADDSARKEYQAISLLALNPKSFGDSLNAAVIQRAAVGRDFIYLLAEGDGTPISGNVNALPEQLGTDQIRSVEFSYDANRLDGTLRRRARGTIGRVQDGRILLVARDLGDAPSIIGRATNAVWIAGLMALGMALMAGLILSRTATRRAGDLARVAADVMAGNLKRRASARATGDEFDDLGRRLNEMLEEIEHLVRSARYAGDAMAHDLRTPLARMRTRLEDAAIAAEQGRTNVPQIESAIAECDQILTTITAVLRLSRLEAIDPRSFQRVNLAQVLDSVTELYEAVFEDAGAGFSTQIERDLWARAEPTLIEQAMVNLLDNALKYMNPTGRVEVVGRRNEQGQIEIGVRDQGPGIPAAAHERVRERFVRLDSARTDASGAGLGLSLVSAVASRHGGTLDLRTGIPSSADQPGLGAFIVLPWAES